MTERQGQDFTFFVYKYTKYTDLTKSNLRSWDLNTSACLEQFHGHTAAITTMSTDPMCEILYTGGGDGLIILWNIDTGRQIKANPTCVVISKS